MTSTELSQEEKLNYIKIQQEELEVLESIYLNDIKILRSSPPFKFEIICRPFLSNFDDVTLSQYNLRIIVEFVKNYPQKPPIIEFEPLTNITQDNVAEIELTTQKVIDKINGTPLLYELVEQARSWIHINLIDQIQQDEEKKQDANTYVRKNYDTYTPVTMESFLVWKQNFEEEMKMKKLEAQKHQQHLIDEIEKKLTGKQFFEQLKNKEIEEEKGSDDDDDDEDDEDYEEEDVQEEEEFDEEANELDWTVE